MNYTQIRIENHFDGKLVVLVLNQPESYNSLTAVMLSELRTAVSEAAKSDTVRCIALRGEGKAFCSGQNLKEALSFGDIKNDRSVQRFIIESYNPLVKEIVQCRKPVVALVHGLAVGAGASLALICDFSFSSESTYFSFAFSKIGLIPDTAATYFLPKSVGRQTALYLAFTGKKISSLEAVTMGLTQEVFADEEFQGKSMDLLKEICNLPTKALGLTRKAIDESYDNKLKEQLDLEGILQQSAAETHDFMEGVQAFIEKRKPEFLGR